MSSFPASAAPARRCGFCGRPTVGDARWCDDACHEGARRYEREAIRRDESAADGFRWTWPLPGPVRVVRNLNRRPW